MGITYLLAGHTAGNGVAVVCARQAHADGKRVRRAAAREACLGIVERRLEGKNSKGIAKELDLTEYNMGNCSDITRRMEAAGLPEPFRRLTEWPNHVMVSSHRDMKGVDARRSLQNHFPQYFFGDFNDSTSRISSSTGRIGMPFSALRRT